MYKQAGYNRAVSALADQEVEEADNETTTGAARRSGSTQR
jgi:hypothetical protein